MQHLAIDLGGRESQICIREAEGTIVEEKRLCTDELGDYLKARPPSRVVMETCSEAFRIADRALAAGHEVRVVPATLVRALGVGARRTKTDVRDARALSEVSTHITHLPSVHIPSTESRKLKQTSTARESLVKARTQLVNSVRGWMRSMGVRIRSGGVETFPMRVRDTGQLPDFVEAQLKSLDVIIDQSLLLERELEKQAKADSVCRRLMSVPGVGPLTATRFRAAIDVIGRFAGAHKVEAYLGMTPGERSSSDTQRRLGITKAGSPAVRHMLMQAAWAARRSRPRDPMVLWALEVEKRRGKFIAMVALGRKLAGVMYALWRDGTLYTPRTTPAGAAM